MYLIGYKCQERLDDRKDANITDGGSEANSVLIAPLAPTDGFGATLPSVTLRCSGRTGAHLGQSPQPINGPAIAPACWNAH
jgi:hypothetical protein